MAVHASNRATFLIRNARPDRSVMAAAGTISKPRCFPGLLPQVMKRDRRPWSFYIPLSLLQTSTLGLGKFHRNQFAPVGLITPSGGLGSGNPTQSALSFRNCNNSPRLYTCFCRNIHSLPPTEVNR